MSIEAMRPPDDVAPGTGTSATERSTGRPCGTLTEASLTWLRTNQQVVNALNVFPVPDGDTGTNMTLTMQSAIDALGESCESSVSKVGKSVAHGALMGARGNSGVILSQLWRGFARALDDDADGWTPTCSPARSPRPATPPTRESFTPSRARS